MILILQGYMTWWKLRLVLVGPCEGGSMGTVQPSDPSLVMLGEEMESLFCKYHGDEGAVVFEVSWVAPTPEERNALWATV